MLALASAAALASIVVAAAPRPSLRLSEPRSTLVRRGEVSSVRIRIRREHGFHGRVVLGVWRLPPGSRATWRLPDGRRPHRKRPDRRAVVIPRGASSATLVIRTTRRTALGRYRIRVSAMGRRLPSSRRWLRVRVLRGRGTAGGVLDSNPIRGGTQQSAGAPSAASETFGITVTANGELHPGISVPLDVRVTNPLGRPVSLGSLQLSVDERTSKAGCSGSANYAVVQPDTEGNRVLQPGANLLSGARLAMRDLPANQDACKGAVVTVRAEGSASE